MNRNSDTLKSSNLIHGTVSPKRGRPIEITSTIKEGLIDIYLSRPTQTLQDIASDFNVSETIVRNILNEENIHFLVKNQFPHFLMNTNKIMRLL